MASEADFVFTHTYLGTVGIARRWLIVGWEVQRSVHTEVGNMPHFGDRSKLSDLLIVIMQGFKGELAY